MHQVVLATHSPGIIRWLPPEAIKVLVVDPTTGKVVLPSQSSPADEAFFYIGEPIAGKTTVIVEDELAKHLVMKALKRGGESFASRFEVKFYPGGSQTLWSRYLPVFSADGRSDTLVLFDGDRRPSTDLPDPAGVPEAGSEKLRETLNSCAGVRISFGVDGGAEGGDKSQIDSAVRGLVKWAREHVDYLPGAIPEAFVWNNMVKTVETEVFENNPDPKRRFDDLARKELGREPSENVSSQDILATQLRRLDGPYFHHRAVVAAAPEAEEYGVDVVFSDLKSAVDKTDVAQKFAGAAAITARIQEIAGGSPTLRLTHGRLDAPQQFDVDVKDAIKIVVDGNSVAHGAISTPNKPGIKVFRKEISSLFSTDP